MNPAKTVLILYVHPAQHRSRVNRVLLDAVSTLDGVTIHDLYETYPDFYIDVGHEQALLRQHDIIVFQHPLYWYSCPALLKEWQDVVLEHGFAFGQEGTALHGKYLMQAVSSGGREYAYCHEGSSHFSLAELLQPFEQTAYLCGMIYLQPHWVAGTHYLNDADISAHAETYRSRISALRDDAPATPFRSVEN